ncbi:hypothetical protein [Streptomyces sp. NPDC057301]|uniref:hypothetical protein n=1 Tax=Streptomyces sp. NPDC057301 TaxID=3346093 RepID=UPI00362551F7
MPESSDSAASTGEQTSTGEQGTAADAGTPPSQPPASPPAGEQQVAEAAQRADEAAAERDQLRAALDAVQQALNPGGTSKGEHDPTQLAAERDKQLEQVAAELRTAQVELAAHRSATEHGARADRLLNSRAFLDTVAGLDPKATTFEQQLGEQIKAAVEADPDLYRAVQTPARGGAEFNGPPSADKRPATLRDAIAARLTS